MSTSDQLRTSVGSDGVAIVEIQRPPENYLDTALVGAIADAYAQLEHDARCRAIVLCSAGKHFSAGARLAARPGPAAPGSGRHLYDEVIRLFEGHKPVVAAVQGAAVGAGLGLAMSADFRVAAPESRFCANFAQLGFHHGFGLSVTLRDVAGIQVAKDLLLTGRRVRGDEAHALGLCDRLVPEIDIREAALALAAQIATSAPLAVRTIHATLQGDYLTRLTDALTRERVIQESQHNTADRAEGIAAYRERRTPIFHGH
ncbi:enoyl-CoA hydratase/isomerase family protein [Rhodococcus sp. NM-2]|uniref:enoyl-CoA hydratase/isomerase family protein n=1 Tax=Rhodococcus sp. NM-2 TaxID=3401174 RepID=UPI003AAB6A10